MHSWDLSINEAIELQKELSKKIICRGKPGKIDFIAGVDLAYDKKKNLGFCVIVLFTFPGLEIYRVYCHHDVVKFPYVPGLLSFREGPLFLKTFPKLHIKPDLIIFDGQGIAHPRRLGIASHMGLFLEVPSIGCAKSRLYGNYEEPGVEKFSRSMLYDKENRPIGTVLRTRSEVKPVFVSPGHLIGIDESVEIIKKCVTKYRLPEPTRIADIEVAKYKKSYVGIRSPQAVRKL